MNDQRQTNLALKTLGASVVLGILGNLLLRDAPWGIGFTLYAALVIGVGLYLNRQSDLKVTRDVRWAVPAAMLFATAFAWRDADALKVLNGTAVAMCVGLLALRARTGGLTIATLTDYPFRLFGRWFLFVADFIRLLDESGKESDKSLRSSPIVKKVAMGLLLAAPILLVFGGLFMSADATFERLVDRMFSFDMEAIWYHLVFTLMGTWLVGGFFRNLYAQVAPPPSNTSVTSPPTIGMTELGIVLGALDLLFASFVIVQFRHFFGGDSVIQTTAGLGYADYARRGFFELLSVVALALTVLVGSHHVLRRSSPQNPSSFNLLAAGLVALVFVVLASAAHRMGLYVQAYGISQLRIYCIAIMGWLGVVLTWFCFTVLRDKSHRFAFGALASFGVAVFALNAVNPDGIVAQVNTGRVANHVDTAYLSDLSADAVPSLVAALPHVRSDIRDALYEGLAAKKKELGHRNWRSWSLGCELAHRALK